MSEHSRYQSSANEAGMAGEVLKNKPGLTDPAKLMDAEAFFFDRAFRYLIVTEPISSFTFDVAMLLYIHKYFLGPLYSWAGQTRTVNISKGDTMFCSANFIASALKDFELVLKQNTPTSTDTKKQIATKLAVIHCELNAIHPFREGNGRTIRLFLDLFAIRAGYNPIIWNKRPHKTYIQACILGMNQDYAPMSRVIQAGLVKTK